MKFLVVQGNYYFFYLIIKFYYLLIFYVIHLMCGIHVFVVYSHFHRVMANGLVVIAPSLFCGFTPQKDTPLDEEQKRAIVSITGGKNVVLHGRSGSGKTTVAEAIGCLCDEVACPVNFYGIQDLFRAPHKDNPMAIATEGLCFPSIVADASTIIIDNYTAISANVIQALDLCIQKYADTDVSFGGKQMVFIGDVFAFSLNDVYDVVMEHDHIVLKEDYVHCSLMRDFLDGIVDSMRTGCIDVNTSCIINHMLYRAPPFKTDTVVCMTTKQVLEYNHRVYRRNACMLSRQAGLSENETPNIIAVNKRVRFTHDVRNKQGEIIIRRGSRGDLVSADSPGVVKYEGVQYIIVTEIGTLQVSVDGEEYTIIPQKIGGEHRFPLVGAAAITYNDVYEEDREEIHVYISTECVPKQKILRYVYSIASLFISIHQIHVDKHSMELQECLS